MNAWSAIPGPLIALCLAIVAAVATGLGLSAHAAKRDRDDRSP